jgi:hypothetical protein
VGGSRVDWLARCVGVGYGARGIEARLRCCAFGAVVLPEKKPGNHLTDGGGGTERNGTETEEEGIAGVGQPRGDIRTLTPVAGVEGWILPCCASALAAARRPLPATLGGVRAALGAQCAAVPPLRFFFRFFFPFLPLALFSS